MKKITPEVLRAWVDGELSVQRSAEVGAVVASDVSLAEQASVLEASKLPYKAAMDQNIPPIPDALKAQVEQWSQVADSDGTGKLSLINHWSFFSGAAAASILLLASWFGMSQLNQADPATEWAQQIVSYQNFYVAETVAQASSDQGAIKKLAALKNDYPAFPTSPPDLTPLGYHFKRAQQLGFEGKPVLQMVFFKEGKRPLAICLMPDADPFKSYFAEHELLNSYVWQTGNLRAIVVAEEDSAALVSIANLMGS